MRVMDSLWQLGEGMGFQGDKLEVWRITCPFCNESGNFSFAFHGEKKKPNSDNRLNFDVYQCKNCVGFVHVFWSAGEGFGRGLYGFRVLPWPLDSKPKPSDNWPDGMKTFWVQAHDSLRRENLDAATVMARSAVQFIARERGAKASKLKGQIDELAAQGVLHPLMKDWAHEVRLLGNDSAHPDPYAQTDVTLENVKDVVNLLDLLLTYLYDLPKQVEDFRKRNAPKISTP